VQQGVLNDYEIDLPNLATQREIAATLSALDDKIAVNTKLNHNLEQTAQAIFKAWFVDFEPFGGAMPDDWRKVPLGELSEAITKGTTPTTLKRPFVDHGINFVKAESILDDHSFDFSKLAFIDAETNTMLSRSIIKERDILFTIAGTLGRFGFVCEDLVPANTNQAVAIIRADISKISPIMLYSFFIGGLQVDFYKKNIQQAVQANLSLTTIKALPIDLPPQETLTEYSALVEPLFSQVFANNAENRKLATIRDTLLPRFMSGELSVNG
jgi:type I restriction enzyme S subunit